jgi:hypothetical protein
VTASEAIVIAAAASRANPATTRNAPQAKD